ncbi:hypothetical protein M405DRAFT_847594 [Rhizopogon salebrosus TDB-379]|nr:hypothetical protein M405DRAFT_847594 [Rhizopogon salebrosus TDB-379]
MAAAKTLRDSHTVSGGAPKTAKSCLRHWATLKTNCLVVQKLHELSRFGWDETRKIVVAGDKVWDNYIKAHPEAKVWRSTPFPLYDDSLCLLMGALHIHHLGNESSPPWLNHDTLLSDDEDDHGVLISEEVLQLGETCEQADNKVPDSVGAHKKRFHGKLTGLAVILGVADALEAIATSFNAPGIDDVPSTPKRRISAIQAICTDTSLSSDERAKVVALFAKDVAIADAYTVISDELLCSMYIRLELGKM